MTYTRGVACYALSPENSLSTPLVLFSCFVFDRRRIDESTVRICSCSGLNTRGDLSLRIVFNFFL